MGSKQMVKLKNTLAILLAVMFVMSMTAAAASADGGNWKKYKDKDFKSWKEDGYYKYGGHKYKGHYDDYNNFWHKHGHYHGKDMKHRYWENHWHRYGYDHGKEWYGKDKW